MHINIQIINRKHLGFMKKQKEDNFFYQKREQHVH